MNGDGVYRRPGSPYYYYRVKINGRWKEFSSKQAKRFVDDYRRLREQEPPIARVLMPEEKRRLFQVAAANPDWIVAYSAGQIAANTTMRGCELKSLRWQDVDLFAKELSVQES